MIIPFGNIQLLEFPFFSKKQRACRSLTCRVKVVLFEENESIDNRNANELSRRRRRKTTQLKQLSEFEKTSKYSIDQVRSRQTDQIILRRKRRNNTQERLIDMERNVSGDLFLCK